MAYRVQEITDHAYMRARERLSFDRRGFRQWVRATSGNWLQVNATYLLDRNVKVTQHSQLFVTPWVEGQGVALCMSDDHAIKTVIAFDDNRYVSHVAVLPASVDPYTRALTRAFSDGDLDARKHVQKLVGAAPIGPLVEEALTFYASRMLTLGELTSVIKTSHKDRKRLLSSLTAISKAS